MTNTLSPADLDSVDTAMCYSDPATATQLLHDRPLGDQITTDLRRVTIRNARPIADKLSLEKQGFVLRSHRATVPFEQDFIDTNLTRRRDMPAINRRYAAEMLPLIRELTGGDEIIAQAGRMILRATPRAGMATSDPTAPLVHLDYTPRAVRDAIDLACRLEGREVPPHSRVALYQTWRVLSEPPHDSLLAICDTQSVSDDATLIMHGYHPPNEHSAEEEVIEIRLCTWEPQHRWYYFKDMTPDEVLIFKGYDSADPNTANGAHVAFDNPAAGTLNPRVSIEARYIVFYG